MGANANALGIGQTITFEGKEYTLSPLGPGGQAKFETFAERRAMDAIRRQRPFMDDAEYDRHVNNCIAIIASGAFTFGQRACNDLVKTLPGLKELLYLCISVKHPTVERELIDRLVIAKVEEAIQALAMTNADPTKPAGESNPTAG